MNGDAPSATDESTPCRDDAPARRGDTKQVVTRRAVTVFVIVFLLAQAVALTWPVATLVNDPSVRILGLPLPFAWTVGWVTATFVVMGWLLMVERTEDSGDA